MMLSVPVASTELVKAAWSLAFRVTGEPVALPFTLNCTVPSGSAVPAEGATVAVMVTEPPKTDGVPDVVSVVVVLTGVDVADMLRVCCDLVTPRELSVSTTEPFTDPAATGSKSTA